MKFLKKWKEAEEDQFVQKVKYDGPYGKFEYDPSQFNLIYDKELGESHFKYVGEETDGSKIKIPEGIKDCSYMFEGSKITSLPEIPKSVEIANRMFMSCDELIDVTIKGSSNLKNISGMFGDCKNLENVKIDNECVNNITECSELFWGCKRLKDFSNTESLQGPFPLNAKNYYGMFRDCESLERVNTMIPHGVEDCGQMFFGCKNLRQAPHMPISVENCEGMFFDCENLIDAPIIPKYVKDCDSMFHGCKALKEAPKIPDEVENCRSMFVDCNNIVEAPKIPENAKDCSFMFYSCNNIVWSPKIPDGVVDCERMFSDCKNLKEAPKIPESVEHCDNMFLNCESLTNMSVPSKKVRDNTNYEDMYKGCPVEIQNAFRKNVIEKDMVQRHFDGAVGKFMKDNGIQRDVTLQFGD